MVLSRSLLQSRLDIVANILELTMWSDPNDGLPLVPITYRHEGEGEGQFNGSVEVGGNCQLRNRSRAEVTEMRIVQELFLLLQEGLETTMLRIQFNIQLSQLGLSLIFIFLEFSLFLLVSRLHITF